VENLVTNDITLITAYKRKIQIIKGGSFFLKLKVAMLQMNIEFGDIDKNYHKAEQMINEACEMYQPNVIVLPELWTTGYDLTNINELADPNVENTSHFLKELAKKNNVSFVGGSIANKTESGIENTLLVIDHRGHFIHKYSKLHLFRLMDEHQYLSPGRYMGLFRLFGHQLAGVICYDIRFPEWIRSHTSRGAEALFVVAEWPMPRLAHWRALLIARAIENQCYVIACNRSGEDPNNHFAGHSIVIDPWGEIVAEADDTESVLIAEIDLRKTREVREMIPVFSDRRPEYYQ
jgi:omega-amidase